MVQSVAAFIPDHANAFAEELWDFLHSGLSVAAYNDMVFGDGQALASAVDESAAADDDFESNRRNSDAGQGLTSTSIHQQQWLLHGLTEDSM